MEQYVFDRFQICLARFLSNQRKCRLHQCDKNLMSVQILQNRISQLRHCIDYVWNSSQSAQLLFAFELHREWSTVPKTIGYFFWTFPPEYFLDIPQRTTPGGHTYPSALIACPA